MPQHSDASADKTPPQTETGEKEYREDHGKGSTLECVARRLAGEHAVALPSRSSKQTGRAFMARLEQQEMLLRQIYNALVGASAAELALSYAAEWFLDNYYLLQRARRQVEEDLSPGYYDELPKLAGKGPLQGYPRIYDVVRRLVAAEGCEVDAHRIRRFLDAYQKVQNLRMGELWAVPIMLRVVILESVIQAALRLTGVEEGEAAPPALQMKYALGDEEVVAACVPGLHTLTRLDWKAFFESVSAVERILAQDPTALHDRMDFETRDRYRKAVEEVAQAAGAEERRVAEEALALARAAGDRARGWSPAEIGWAGLRLPRTAHIGYYLVDKGRSQLERRVGYRPDIAGRLARTPLAYPTYLYIGGITLLTALLLAGAGIYLARAESGRLLQAAALLLLLIPAVSIATGLVNWALSLLIEPTTLPKLDFSEGIPDLCRTVVAIPCMLTGEEEVASLLRQLEGHYLRNPDPNLLFALLSDFSDSDVEETAADRVLLEQARRGIEDLNRRYPEASFYLFHRRRLWNPREGVWMGWERKRGKLHEFNRLLQGAQDTSYAVRVGEHRWLARVRYVITLDADTILPRDSAAALVGAMAHPLNRAEFAENGNRVVDGYTVLQPRTEVRPDVGKRSLFTRVFAGDAGLDLYTLAVSDVYQDLFGEGIYVGKGIYDVSAFERSLQGRVPENALLSHDLFEGIHGRSGLVTDIVLYEDYPTHYLLQVHRTHRWVRGDWQLLPWLLPAVPTAEGWTPNRLRAIDLWKIGDNLRRSLVAPALLLALVAGWTILPGAPIFWTIVALFTPAVRLLAGLTTSLLRSGDGADLKRPLRDSAVRWLLFIAFMPYEAALNVDAFLTTLVRLLFTRRNLLQWTASAHAAQLFGEDVSADRTWKSMISSFLLAAIIGLLLFLVNPSALGAALPLLLLWSLSPELAYWVSRPESPPRREVDGAQRQRLRRLARRTWLFYEQFVGPEDNWLPPDHFQETPKGIVAHRTSPTNVGVYLLSAVAAFELGYTDPSALVARLYNAFEALQGLGRHRGHFLNWIDTTNLSPLPPRYVSTVDSGNLAGSLVALEQALGALAERPAWRWARWEGLLDTVGLLAEAAADLEVEGLERRSFLDVLKGLEERIRAARDAPEVWPRLLHEVEETWQPWLEDALVALLEAAAPTAGGATLYECRLIVERIHAHSRSMRRELDQLLPWLERLEAPPPLLLRPEAAPGVRGAWMRAREALAQIPALGDLAAGATPGREELAGLQAALRELEPNRAAADALAWAAQLEEDLDAAAETAQDVLADCGELARQASRFVTEMDFRFLFNRQRQVFHIGYNLDAGRLDDNYYDLLASEARTASLVAIAKHDAPASHWLYLGRPVTAVSGRRTLLSWSGSMFEYLMPEMLLRRYDETLLGSSVRNAIERQIAYADEHGIPWGISEAGYYAFDAARNYQYQAFGVPGLGFKRGLGEDTVVAPYASLLTLPFRPHAVLMNLDRLDELGMRGRYGYYEAVDFTEERVPPGESWAIVRSYMAHHQGMIMLSLLNFLCDGKMVQHFHADPRIQSVELLLQEQVPQGLSPEKTVEEEAKAAISEQERTPAAPWQVPWQTPMPALHFLSNGRYSVAVTNAGAGFSRWKDVAVTRWRPDTTLDDWGQWLYVQDCESGALWSAGQQPTGALPDDGAELVFHAHKVAWRRRDNDIVLRAEVVVAPDDDAEIRRVSLYNDSERVRRLRVTSYGEVVLADQEADQRHQAFAKLFVESEYLPDLNALLFRRRPRSGQEAPAFAAHMLVMGGEQEESGRHETDRRRFLGRNATTRNPQALHEATWLSGTTGATLDPIMSLGQEIELEPYETVEMALITAAAASRSGALALLRRYRSWSRLSRTFGLARGRAEHELQRVNFDTPLEYVQRLLSLLFYPHPVLRAEHDTLAANSRGQPGLWAYGISGDYPILLLKLSDEAGTSLLRELLRVHAYWRSRDLLVSLVILNEQQAGYQQKLHSYIHRMIRHTGAAERLQRRGGIFVLGADQLNAEDRRLLASAARVRLDASRGSLRRQVGNIYDVPTRLPGLEPVMAPQPQVLSPVPRPDDLLFDNGFGGFSPAADGEPAGKEYVIYLRPGESTPAPWINVIANPEFGFLVSESGSGYTWAVNSGENRLTSWRNDPVSDQPAEALYLRDEETAEIWSPTPQPAPADEPYLVRHGAGYTVFEHQSHGLKQEVHLFAAADDPVKIVRVRLENATERQRRLTATYYAEWVLGASRAGIQQYLLPEYAADCHALLVRNPYNVEFGERVAFLAAGRELHGLTTDRTEFFGRLGSLQRPAALSRVGLESSVRAGLDSCGVLQLHVDLAPGAGETFYFLLGQGADREDALRLLGRYQGDPAVDAAWEEARRRWDDILGTVQVDTPDLAMNILLNRWLLYQTLSCRLWGRSALYQSSGAYGFRDQLQDVIALIHARPELTRRHILRAARHQFEAGDVLHWWHPPSGRGVRTRIKDDLLWLPYVTAQYVAATGDEGILEERVPFLQGEPLGEGEEERYGHYASTPGDRSLFEHCVRALNRGSTRGRHGLPLMGAGDWNDGMNRVGIEGEGESVWLGWFLYATLNEFAALCERTDRPLEARAFRERARAYRQALEESAWDGAWYRRAYYDDGVPLGSRLSEECKIDAIAQSWSVLSAGGEASRTAAAMASLERRLIDRDESLLLLFTPPFDRTIRDPGYIKGYPPGVRENGGQYTHAALWTIWAFAEMGQGEKAEALFRLINPIYRALDREAARKYRVEPYVIAADVYSAPLHTGQGGWTWYTGSSGWLYRLGLEAILGVRREGDTLRLLPRIPQNWSGYTVTYRYGDATYHIAVVNAGRKEDGKSVIVDGVQQSDDLIPLSTDGQRRHVEVRVSSQDKAQQ